MYYAEQEDYFWTGGLVPGYTEDVRDPSISKYNGKYWVVHTHPVAGPPLTDFTLTSSTDLVTWDAPQYVSVAEIPGAQNTWAPEWVRNENGTTYLDSVDGFPRIAVSVNPNADYNTCCFSIYIKAPTNAAMTTWANAAVLTINGIGTENPIDPFIIKKGGTWYLWWKAQSGGDAPGTGGTVGYATGGANLTDAYTLTQSGGGGNASWNWAGLGAYHEGPMLLKKGSSWRLFVDAYQNSFTLGQIYFSDSKDDWVTWSPRIQTVSPGQAKQGTVISFP